MRKSEITPAVVSCLLREQFPDLADLPVTPMDVDGWDNSSFRIGADFTARLPTDDGYVPAVAKEHQWLPVLAARLPLPVPEPVAVGAPGCGFPRPWSVYRWLPGETASAERVTDLPAFARDVADFLSCLQTVDTRGGPVAGAHSSGRGGPLSVYDDDVQDRLDVLPAHLRRDEVLAVWRTAVSIPFAAEPVWFHGDMAPSNLLVRDGRLAAVIDFGTCGVGDPACDLALAWTFLDAGSRRGGACESCSDEERHRCGTGTPGDVRDPADLEPTLHEDQDEATRRFQERLDQRRGMPSSASMTPTGSSTELRVT